MDVSHIETMEGSFIGGTSSITFSSSAWSAVFLCLGELRDNRHALKLPGLFSGKSFGEGGGVKFWLCGCLQKAATKRR